MAESKTSFSIAGRYYRLHPYPASKMLGYGEKVLKFPFEETALIAIHCWNINFPDGPQVIPQFDACAGWAEYIDRAREIIEYRIHPVIELARSVRIPVVHVAAPYHAGLHQQYQLTKKLTSEDVENTGFLGNEIRFEVGSDSSGKKLDDGGSVGGRAWQQEYQEDVFGPGFTQSWNDLTGDETSSPVDFAAVLGPQPEDYVVATSLQLNEIMRKLGIWNLIYVGFLANNCLLDAPCGMRDMGRGYGYRCILLRDCTTGLEQHDTISRLSNTRAAIRYVEFYIGYTATSDQFLCAAPSSSE